MKTKILLATIAAPLFFGGMQISALASTCSTGSTGSVTCDTIDRRTSINTVNAMQSYDLASVVLSHWSQNYQDILAYAAFAYPTYSGTHNQIHMENRSYEIEDTTARNSYVTYFVRYDLQMVEGLIKSISARVSNLHSSFTYFEDGAYSVIYGEKAINSSSISLSVPITAVPGPEAGAGLGALAMLGVAYWAKRRRNEQSLAA